MIAMLTRLFARSEPALSEAAPRDARALAGLHAASFHRGWSDGEFEHLLLDRHVVAHRAMVGRSLVGFIMSRRVPRKPKSSRSPSPPPGAARDWRASCSICICAGSRDSAPARFFSKWTKATSRRAGFIGAPASARSGAGKAIIPPARARPH